MTTDHKGGCHRRVEKIDGEGIVDDATDARGSDSPCVRAAIRVQPRGHLIGRLPKSLGCGMGPVHIAYAEPDKPGWRKV
jgi:hypothetical protein